jgi:hypothetical protein
MLISQSGKFQKFKFKTLAGISSNTGRHKSKQIEFTVGCTVLARSRTVAILLDDATVEPSAPCPVPSHEKGRDEEKCAQGPLPVFFFLCVADCPGCARADPQPSAAEATPSQHTPEAVVPGATSERHQDPPHWPPFGRLAPGLLRL